MDVARDEGVSGDEGKDTDEDREDATGGLDGDTNGEQWVPFQAFHCPVNMGKVFTPNPWSYLGSPFRFCSDV